MDFIARLARAIGIWLINKSSFPKVVIGYDCRFGGKMFAENIAKVLAMTYIKVYFSSDTITVGMLSNGIVEQNADLGIYLSAGIHSFEFNGVYLKDKDGKSLAEREIKNIADLISEQNEIDPDLLKIDRYKSSGLIVPVHLENSYITKIQNLIPEKPVSSNLPYVFDIMHGACSSVIKKLFPDAALINYQCNPGFNGIPPHPAEGNLAVLKSMVADNNHYKGGIAFDGAGENLALIDEYGNYIEYNKMLVMILYALARYDSPVSKVILGNPITTAIDKLAAQFDFEVVRTADDDASCMQQVKSKKGFVGALNHQGIALGENIPERDAVFIAYKLLIILEKHELTFHELLKQALNITGDFSYDQTALKINKTDLRNFKKQVEDNLIQSLGKYEVKKTEVFNGYRFLIDDKKWVLLRPSAKKMMMHFYVQAENYEQVKELIRETYRLFMAK